MSLRMGGVPTCHVYPIRLRSLAEVRIVPFGDIHWGSDLCARNMFLRALQEAADHPNVWFIGQGDYLDLSKAGDRDKMRDLADSTISPIERQAESDLQDFYDTITPYVKGRCIGLIEGNHHYRFKDNKTCTERLCEMLDTAYLGCLSSVTVPLRYKHHTAELELHTAHDSGGGSSTAGGRFSKQQKIAGYFKAHIYLSGHAHQLGCIVDQRIEQCGQNWKHTTMRYVQTGSWQKGYVPGQANWLVEKTARPAVLGMPIINVKPRYDEYMTGSKSFYFTETVTV